jgi:chromosome segregation ATPase
VHVRHTQKARRPYKVSTILEIGDALADAQKAATQLQDDCEHARKERDAARVSEARLAAELWARKPLEERVASLIEELAQARAEIQPLLQTIAENADQFAEHTAALVQERDEARAEVQRLQDILINLYSLPTARQVQDMLRTWATELDWSADCFDSLGREQIDTIQKTLIAVMERIDMLNPEVNTDDN